MTMCASGSPDGPAFFFGSTSGKASGLHIELARLHDKTKNNCLVQFSYAKMLVDNINIWDVEFDCDPWGAYLINAGSSSRVRIDNVWASAIHLISGKYYDIVPSRSSILDIGTWGPEPPTSIADWQLPHALASLNGDNRTLRVGGHSWVYASTPPTGPEWKTGDICWNTQPSPGGNIGWTCVSEHQEVAWRSFGTVAE